MWTFRVKEGELLHADAHRGFGYSGAGAGKNNPDFEHIHDVGPIPRGLWLIEGPPTDTLTHGPYVLRLTPTIHTETFGRCGFLIHADSIIIPGSASMGCVILAKFIRIEVWESKDREFMVVT